MALRCARWVTIVLALAGCSAAASSGGGPSAQSPEDTGTVVKAPIAVRLSGAVEKGPFLLGSSVSVTPVASAVSPAAERTASSPALADGEAADADSGAATGQVFKTETQNDRGEFDLTVSYQGAVSIEGTGYYYNEATGDLSSSPLTLRAFHQLGETDESTHVNLLTHLSYQRVQHLIATGVEASAAVAQAESELHDALGLGTPKDSAGELTLAGGDNDDDAYLFAVSTLFAQAAYLDARNSGCRGTCADSKLQELLNTTAAYFSIDGRVSDETVAVLTHARQTIDNDTVMAALGARLAKTGSTAAVPNLNRVIPWSLPQSVTACAETVSEAVPESCRLAICGSDHRTTNQDEEREQAFWQAHVSAASCGADCWAAVQCTLKSCLITIPSSGARVVDSHCVTDICHLDETLTTSEFGASVFAEHAFYWDKKGACIAR